MDVAYCGYSTVPQTLLISLSASNTAPDEKFPNRTKGTNLPLIRVGKSAMVARRRPIPLARERRVPQERQQFAIAVKCLGCGASGSALWEESGSTDRTRGSERKLVSLQGDLHAETGRTRSCDPVIVCNICDEILPD